MTQPKSGLAIEVKVDPDLPIRSTCRGSKTTKRLFAKGNKNSKSEISVKITYVAFELNKL